MTYDKIAGQSMDTVRLDSHQHFWSLERGDYDWLRPDLGVLYQDFLPEHFLPLLSRSGVNKSIVVQAAATVEETHFLLGLAKQYDFIAGVVGWVDLEDETVPKLLEQLAADPHFLGVRPMIQDIADPDWMLRPKLARGIEALIEHDLSFDALVRPGHLGNLLSFSARYPELRIILDHAAKPDILHDGYSYWAAYIEEIAASTQMYCKLSGLLTEAGDRPSIEDVRRYAEHLLAAFGAPRLMWGSDWPVVNLVSGFQAWHDMAWTLLDGCTAQEKQSIFGEVAQACYRIPVGVE